MAAATNAAAPATAAAPTKSMALGTGSALKNAALRTVFGPTSAFGFTIVSGEIKSGVSDQPIGRDETVLGATNRANGAFAKYPDARCAVGIESGMIPHPTEDGKWIDIAAIVMLFPAPNGARTTVVHWSETIDIPKEWSDVALKYKGETYCSMKDPHIILTKGKKTRQSYLEDTLQLFIPDLKTHAPDCVPATAPAAAVTAKK